jgi:hypothetical protein
MYMKKYIIALILVLAVLFVSACSSSRDVRYSRRDRDRNGVVVGQGTRDEGVVIRKRHRRNRDDHGVIIKKDTRDDKAVIGDDDDQVVVKKKKTIKDDDGDVVVKTRRERRRD